MLSHPHDLHRVGAAGLPHRLSDGEHDDVARHHLAALDEQLLGGDEHVVAVAVLRPWTNTPEAPPMVAASEAKSAAKKGGER